jgi:prepilin signal peptidase PulO-like enzyme (type II secretory pathway)
METWQIYMLVFAVIQTFFVFALGACVGSLVNVLVYRMPLGISVISPPSRCPHCQTRLTFRENIPVLGWILLGGKCRFCKSPISAEYPLVEAFVGGLFAFVYLLWFVLPPQWGLGGITVNWFRPEWTRNGLDDTWPTLTIVLCLLGSLTAMTLVDAKTTTIPLALAWTPTILALLAHPIHAAWIQDHAGRLFRTADGWTWTLASPGRDGWPMIGAALGGTLGVVISNILLASGLIRRSWDDYEHWERGAIRQAQEQELFARGGEIAMAPSARPSRVPPAVAVDGALDAATRAAAVQPVADVVLPMFPAPDVAALAAPARNTPASPTDVSDVGATRPGEDEPLSSNQSPVHLWLEYPHARREVMKEVIFLAPIIGFALAGAGLAVRLAGPWRYDPSLMESRPSVAAPLWLDVLAGVLAGYLIGAGVVWGVRILGTIAFGREAMGLGDVHLLAAVGACVGWIDATLTFFGAAFVGLAYALASSVFRGMPRAMPYGPHLAVAAVLVILGKPLVEQGLTLILRAEPPIDLP